MNRAALLLLLLAFSGSLATLLSGCGVLVGNVKPMDEKSQSYGVADLSATNPDWTKLDPKSTGSTSSDTADVAYQSKSTASIISLDSACGSGDANAGRSLKSLTDTLLLGTSDVTLRDEEDLTIQDTPALQTTIQGRINGENIKLRAVVLKRQRCIYDLVYVGRPETFAAHEGDFSRFVASLRLK